MSIEQRTVADFMFKDRGIDSPSYFQGAGTAFTDWDDVFVGVGDTAREAAEDAIESAVSVVWDWPTLSAYRNEFDDTIGAHIICDEHAADCTSEDPDTYEYCDCHDTCELHHYCALYVRYADEVTS